MSQLRLVVLGLDNSHPFVDVQNFTSLHSDVELLLVADRASARTKSFLTKFPQARLLDSLEQASLSRPDALLVTLKPSMFLAQVPGIASLRVPTFVNKPGVSTQDQVREAGRLLDGRTDHLMTSSVLRYAPNIRSAGISPDDVTAIYVSVAHGVEHWKDPASSWQAEVAEGGSLVGALGYHGFELVDELLGGDFEIVDVTTQNKGSGNVTGGNYGRIALRWSNGRTGLIVLDASGNTEEYRIRLESATGTEQLVLDTAENDGFGYLATMRQFKEHVAGARPLAWDRSWRLLELGAQAHRLAYDARQR